MSGEPAWIKKMTEWSTAVCDTGDHKINIRGYPLGDLIRNLSFSETLFLTVRGELPTKGQARALDAVLCGIVDHAFFTPTTVAARVITSASAESIIPGIAGGLLTVGSRTVSPQDTAEIILYSYNMMKDEGLSMEETARKAIEVWKSEKRMVPGLGHPLHPTGDPRAIALKEVAQKNGVWGERADLYEEIHKTFVKMTKKNIPINIDGMMGTVLTELGFKPKEMAGIAAISFMPGLIAHTVEESELGGMKIALGDYTGVPERKLPDR